LPPEIQREIEKVARRQSQALADATTIVHRAFHYRQGGSGKLGEGMKLVAVDVEFRDHNRDLDLDDVDVIDGATGENYGSGPDIRLLRPDGTLEQNNAMWESDAPALRMLLIYAIPSHTQSIRLGYWGHSLTPEPTPIGEGELRYGENRLMETLEFWPYPVSWHYDGVWQWGRWLLVELSTGEGAAVVDLHAWPPQIDHWECNLLQAIQPAPQGGWIVITRVGHTREDIRWPVWHHPKDKPGSSVMSGEAVSPGEKLRGIAVIDGTTFVYEKRALYRFSDGQLEQVEELTEPKGVEGYAGTQFTHGQISLADGRRLLLWDGDAYALVNGQLEKTWPLGIDEMYEFMTVPWGQDGFFFIDEREVYRVKPGKPRQPVMAGVENVMGIRPGPSGGLLFHLGDNDAGYVGGIWFPDEDAYIPVRIGELSDKLTTTEAGTIHWSEATDRFYFATRSGIFTVPGEEILEREHEKLPDIQWE
jgi:hypothetical protein